jgi:tetratricopeptide (TPR) repeat protein
VKAGHILRYIFVAALAARIVLSAASGLFAVGSSASGGGSIITRDPEEEARIAYEKGQAFVEQEKYSKAANSFKRAISYKSDFAEAHEYIGEAYRRSRSTTGPCRRGNHCGLGETAVNSRAGIRYRNKTEGPPLRRPRTWTLEFEVPGAKR